MKQEWKVIEEHCHENAGNSRMDTRIVSVCRDHESARRALSNAFDERWNEHSFPSDSWLSECLPPEESPDDALFVSKYPDEGEFRFRIEHGNSEVSV